MWLRREEHSATCQQPGSRFVARLKHTLNARAWRRMSRLAARATLACRRCVPYCGRATRLPVRVAHMKTETTSRRRDPRRANAPRMRNAFISGVVWCASSLCFCPYAFAQEQSFEGIHHLHTAWTARDGLTGGVRAITQT